MRDSSSSPRTACAMPSTSTCTSSALYLLLLVVLAWSLLGGATPIPTGGWTRR